MEYIFTKIIFKGKEYLVLSSSEMIPNEPDHLETVNDRLEELFGKDADDVIFFPTKVQFYGFDNINSKQLELDL